MENYQDVYNNYQEPRVLDDIHVTTDFTTSFSQFDDGSGTLRVVMVNIQNVDGEDTYFYLPCDMLAHLGTELLDMSERYCSEDSI